MAVRVVKLRKAELAKVPGPISVPLPVHVARIQKGFLEITRSCLGVVRPMVSSSLAPQVTGQILEVRVREGDRVRKGQILVRLDDRTYVSKVGALKAQLAGARSTLATQEGIYKRNLMLYEHKALSKEALDCSRSARDEARARVLSLEKELEAARLEVSYCTLKAPFDGVVTKRLQDPGDLALPGKPILVLENAGAGYRVLVQVPQDLVPVLKAGDEVYLAPSAQGPSVKATLSRIYPAVATGLMATVEVGVKEPPLGLPSGSVLEATLVVARKEGLKVPLGALLHKPEGVLVWAVKPDGELVPKKVEVLAANRREALVSGEISPGEKVVVGTDALLLRLHPGLKVVPLEGGGDEVR